jgi:hypothetical protein
MRTTNAEISRAGHPICFVATEYSSNTDPFEGMLRHVSAKCFLARRKRTGQQWVEEVGAGNGHPGSGAREDHSLLVDQHVDVELTQGGGAIRHSHHE